MTTIGKVEYPDITLDSAIEYVSKSFRVLSEGIDREGLAQALSLKNNTGNFARVLSSLRRYGLIEGHGTFKKTALSDQIIHGFTQEDKEKGRANAWLRVDLIRELHKRYPVPPSKEEGEYLAFLSKLTGAEPAEVRQKAGSVLDLFAEAVKDLKSTRTDPSSYASIDRQDRPFFASEAPITPVSPSGLIDAKLGDVYIRIPRTSDGLQIARKVIDLLSLQIQGQSTPTDSDKKDTE
jgi:hypothetical protein